MGQRCFDFKVARFERIEVLARRTHVLQIIVVTVVVYPDDEQVGEIEEGALNQVVLSIGTRGVHRQPFQESLVLTGLADVHPRTRVRKMVELDDPGVVLVHVQPGALAERANGVCT
ncbi:MAG: hypothetical protein EB072_17185, partial [Betaproteobacteria bacterium]|nr:hypothetical protein [Betaproteobacteria bacterium]